MTTTAPDPIVQPSAYLVSVLPDGHPERYLFTVQVRYRGEGAWTVEHNGRTLSADGSWSFGHAWSAGDRDPVGVEWDAYYAEQAAWVAAHRYDEHTALQLAKTAAAGLSYNGRGAADYLGDAA